MPVVSFAIHDASKLESTSCSVNGGAPTSCSSPFTITSGQTSSGIQKLTVTVVDVNGNTGSADYSWTAIPLPKFVSYPQGVSGYSQIGSNQVNHVFFDGTTLYVSTIAGLSISTDLGKTFATRTTLNGLGSNIVNQVQVSGGTLYAATAGGVSISTDGGKTFTNHPLSIVTTDEVAADAVAISGTNVFVATPEGLYRSSDAGMTYKFVMGSVSQNYLAGVRVFGNHVYFFNGGNGIYVSADSGATFTNVTTSNGLTSNFVYDLTANGNAIYAATGSGLSVSNDGGMTFTAIKALGTQFVEAVDFSGNTLYAVTNNGSSVGLWTSSNGGSTFNTLLNVITGLSGFQIAKAVQAVGSRVWIATSGGLASSSDGGATFNLITSNNDVEFISTPGETGFFANNGYYSLNQEYVSGNDVYIATNGGGIAYSADGGATFKTLLPGAQVTAIYVNGNTIYCGLSDGLYESVDGGKTFSHLTSYNSATGISLNAEISQILVSGTTLYVTSWADGLYLSHDGGTTFVAPAVPPTSGTYRLSVTGNTVYAAAFKGLGISKDGGNTFTMETNATALAGPVDDVYANGNTLYVATAMGLSISNDGGKTFTTKKIVDGLPENQIDRVVVSGSNVYVGTVNGMAVSSDGGNTFRPVTIADGLSDNFVTDIAVSGATLYTLTLGGLSRSQ